jgi:RNA polymerase-binding transcription factor DksA
METIRKRLEQDLKTVGRRLRQLEGAEVIEESLGAPGDNSPFADEVDGIQASERREIGFATRELLVERANRLVAALDRRIAPARLRVMPEVETCVRCQDRLERLGRQLEPAGIGAEAEED